MSENGGMHRDSQQSRDGHHDFCIHMDYNDSRYAYLVFFVGFVPELSSSCIVPNPWRPPQNVIEAGGEYQTLSINRTV